jgi:hypothetical protein
MITHKIFSKNTLLWILAKRSSKNPYSYKTNDFIHNVTKILIKNLLVNLTLGHIQTWLDESERKKESYKLFTSLETCSKYLYNIEKDLKKNLYVERFEVICRLYNICSLPFLSQESMNEQVPDENLL